jgi:hypothetical protein
VKVKGGYKVSIVFLSMHDVIWGKEGGEILPALAWRASYGALPQPSSTGGELGDQVYGGADFW